MILDIRLGGTLQKRAGTARHDIAWGYARGKMQWV